MEKIEKLCQSYLYGVIFGVNRRVKTAATTKCYQFYQVMSIKEGKDL